MLRLMGPRCVVAYCPRVAGAGGVGKSTLVETLAGQGWFSDTLRFITPFCQPSAFQNWPYRGLPDALTQYYGSNLPRLTQVKKAYDPNNLFHYEQSIPVASA